MCVSLWDLACFDALHVFFLGETDVEGPSLVNVYIYVGNIRVRLPKGLTEDPTRRTQGISGDCLGNVNPLNKKCPFC